MIIQEFLTNNGVELYKVSSTEGYKIARVESPDVLFDSIINTYEKTKPEQFIEFIIDDPELTKEEMMEMLKEVF